MSCVEWIGYINKDGYGLLGKKLAHRLSYEKVNGDIPKGLVLDHLCRNRSCINVDHLEAVTPQINNSRSMSPTAINARKTYCKYGHSLDDCYIQKLKDREPRRICKPCSLKRNRIYNKLNYKKHSSYNWKVFIS